jgi:hypothetical protein
MFLIFICFSIHKMESREQRNSVTQASRKRVAAAAGVRAWSVLQADEKALWKRTANTRSVQAHQYADKTDE